MKKNSYMEGKERAREEAREWQIGIMNGNRCYWSDLVTATDRFENLGRRYGLLREFRENGIC